MTTDSTLRFGAQTDEVTSLLRIVNLVRTGEATTRPEIGKVTGLGRGVVSQRVDQAISIGFLGEGNSALRPAAARRARCASGPSRGGSSCVPSGRPISGWV
ncbi:hypothetical protein OUO20_18240 [Arthrobacter sp. FX8]|uniref:hypothetical protein n=1 Tax=Arthrobacter sp. FX8 TaxID=2997335 RepID=UPI00227B45C5|nr:hypothetical protein [Arthrobacter sp. FX8]WAJ32975.1 hypothetical protein OUO20_18240 [Arthrobacter sp. FX8]